MFRSLLLLLLMVYGTASPAAVMGQVDCSKLDPRASVSTEKEGEIKASIDGLLKIAKAGGSIRAKAIEDINNLQKGVPVTEQTLIKMRTLFLFCGMFANDKEISPERKVKLYKEMMEVNAVDKPSSKQTAQKKKTADSRKKVDVKTDSTKKEMGGSPNPQANVIISSQAQSGGITAQNVIINKLEGENRLAQTDETKFAALAVNVKSNIIAYYLLKHPFNQKLTIINKSPYDWRDITLATFSAWILNHKIDIDNPDSFMRRPKQYCGFIKEGGQQVFEIDTLSKYYGDMDLKKGTYLEKRTSVMDLVLNPYKYAEFHSKKPVSIKSFDPYMAEEKATFMKAFNIARERNPFLDFVAHILSQPEAIRGGLIDINFVSGTAMTSNGPKKFISVIPILNAWNSQTGNLSRVDDIVFYNSVVEVPFFAEVDGDKLIPHDCPNIYVYERPNVSLEMRDKLFKEGYEVDLKPFTIENVPYKEIGSYRLSGSLLIIKGVKPFGGLNTIKSGDNPRYTLQMTPFRYKGAPVPTFFNTHLEE